MVEEQLSVGKREVAGGGVRVRTRIIETPVQEHVLLVGGQASQAGSYCVSSDSTRSV